MGTSLVEKPVRAAVFDTIAQADQAVAGLLKAGFTQDQITVICSDRTTEDHYHDYEHQHPAGADTPAATAKGSAIGTAIAGLASLGMASAGGFEGLSAGAVMVPAGAVFGGMIGAMMTERYENELACFYDQAVSEGKILVAVEDHSDRHHELLAEAERVLMEAGAQPIQLAAG